MLWVLICYFSGWYMALKPDEGDQMSRAVVQSPTMKQASGTCTLHFYYNMYGEGMFCICKCVCAAIKMTCSCSLRM